MSHADQKTLTELEGDDWGSASTDSYIEQTCYELRHKPIREFTVEDLRIMIGQDLGLSYLIPIAVERLKHDPFAEGMHYRGDLLCAVLRADKNFYSKNKGLTNDADGIVRFAESSLQELDEIDRETFVEAFEEARQLFFQSKRGKA